MRIINIKEKITYPEAFIKSFEISYNNLFLVTGSYSSKTQRNQDIKDTLSKEKEAK